MSRSRAKVTKNPPAARTKKTRLAVFASYLPEACELAFPSLKRPLIIFDKKIAKIGYSPPIIIVSKIPMAN